MKTTHLVAMLAVAALIAFAIVPDANAAVLHGLSATSGDFLAGLGAHAAFSLAALRTKAADIETRAKAQLDLIKSDTTADQAREIEAEHDRLLAELETTKRQIEAAEREEREAAERAQKDERGRKEAAEAAVTAERQRVSEIGEIGEKLKLGREFVAQHIKSGTTVGDFRSAAIDEKAKAPANQHPRGTGQTRAEVTGQEDAEKRAGAMEVALLHRYDPAAYRETFEATPQAREYRGMALLEMARELLESVGANTRGLSKLEIADCALSMRTGSAGNGAKLVRGGMLSTSDFPNVLANVLTKTLRQAYGAAPQTFRPLVRQVTVPDFKQVSRVQLGEAPQLEKVNERGEFKRGSMSDLAEKYAIATYGKVVAITRQVLVNDDLDAFTRIPMAFGRQAANLESDLVWSIWLANAAMSDSVALFHATHKNLGTGAAIAAASVGAGRLALATQTGLDGVSVLNLDPTFLVVPKALQTTAEQFVADIYPAQTANVVPNSMKKLQIISEPRLDNGVTIGGTTYGGSASNWFLSVDPGQVDTIELAYLEGAEGVYTENRMGFDVDGMEVKVRLDVGAKAIDWRGFWKNPN